MRITVKLFAILRERSGGVPEVVMDVPSGATAGDAAQRLGEKFPELTSFLPRIAFAVNQTYAKADAVLAEGDELALIPPVSGGSGSIGPADAIHL
jgi:molybdopterin converting factor subunit 1